MPNADYQLRHQLFGQQGSMWERQVTKETRTQIRRIVKEAGQASVLAEIDQIAAGAINDKQVLVEDVFFRFTDGNFAVVGQHQRDYEHTETTLSNGMTLHIAYREDPAESSTDPLATSLAKITEDFIRSVERDQGSLPTDRDWYLVPVPENLTPLVIEGKIPDTYLVNGIDFVARDGYIILTDAPAQVLPTGPVRCSSAYKRILPANAYALSAPASREGSRYLAEYAYKSQSAETFQRAAAEYAGLYVFQAPDVVLSVHQLGTDHYLYSLAHAGVIEIRYPHEVLEHRQEIDPGYIISNGFHVLQNHYNEDESLEDQYNTIGWDGLISLNGVLPTSGLVWDPSTDPVNYDVSTQNPDNGVNHVRLYFSGDHIPEHQKFWDWTRRHERLFGVSIWENLSAAEIFNDAINFWEWLHRFYGTQLILVLFEDHTPTINARLHQFVTEHNPQSCNLLLSTKISPAEDILYSPQGVPLVDEYGEYVPATPPPCANAPLSYNGDILALDGNPLIFQICPDE